MQDIYCPRCGEPWEIDTFHDVAEEQSITFRQALDRFYTDGCAATGWTGECAVRTNGRTMAMGALAELMGDDVDGIAALMGDFEYLGMLD